MGDVMTLIGIACVVVGVGSVAAGFIASGAAAAKNYRRQQARADAIRAEIRQLARDTPTAEDVAAYQHDCDAAFDQLVGDQLRDVRDVAHRFYLEAS